MSSPGHLFVVHGRLESLVHDAAVVPTSDRFSVRKHWHELTGSDVEVRHRPLNWPGSGVARSLTGDPLWFISVGVTAGLAVNEVVDRAAAAVIEAAGADLELVTNRVRPMVAVPVVGIDGGGQGDRRGEVVKLLVERLAEVAAEHDVDVALVTPDKAVYAAAQFVRQDLEFGRLDRRAEDEAARLGALAARGELALFMGAGVSLPAGLPSWSQLLENLAPLELQEQMSGLSLLDQAQLLDQSVEDLGHKVAAQIRVARRPSVAHALLAGLECREAVTTNYDRLYETAAKAPSGDRVTAILPWQEITTSRWLMKMHGDVSYPKSIVLTRSHFARFDASTRPAGALLQSLLLTRHLLFVGASLEDDNVLRLMYEVQAFQSEHQAIRKQATLLDVADASGRRVLWENHLHWSTMPGDTVPERARELEIFLDRVALHATTKTSWILDRRFGDLLHPAERGVADQARKLLAALRGSSAAWHPLASALDDMGAGPET